MNDQWSGKILSRKVRPPLAMPSRSSTQRSDLSMLVDHGRSQKPGPTGWSKPPLATR